MEESMKFKDAVLEKLETLNENLDTTKGNMKRHSMTPEQLFEALDQFQTQINQIRALVNRE
jgi:hypothetical protein